MTARHCDAVRAALFFCTAAVVPAAAELPAFLTDVASWKQPEFAAALVAVEEGVESPVARLSWKTPPAVCGIQPQSACARMVNGTVQSLSLVILDAGNFFGFQNRNITGAVDQARQEFDREFASRLEALRNGLRTAAGGKEKEFTLGEKSGLSWPARLYSCGAAFLRIIAVEQQLILLDAFATAEEAQSVRCAAWMSLRKRSPDEFRVWLKKDGLPLAGDREIQGIPMLPQGNRGYCGVAILAMTGHYLGLQTGTEELAVLAGFHYGETKSPDIKDLCGDIARAAGVTARRAGKFDYAQARASIDAGMPVVVFRRWAAERDYIHTLYSGRIKEGDAQAALPASSMEDRKSWPGKNAPAHASLVHGYNDQRREVIFTESWAVAARSRRMRAEELEATSYFAVFFLP